MFSKTLITTYRQGVINISKFSSYFAKDRLDGKVAIVTASTEGIGYSVAERLAKEGAKVVISSRKQNNVDRAVSTLKSQQLTVHGLVCHVGNPDDRKKLYDETIKQFGGVDILVSNAAVNPSRGGVLECDEKAWDKIFDVNLKSSYMLAKEVLPYLQKQGGGKIVFISSAAGYLPLPMLGAYPVSKTALIGLTKAAALQLADQNITVNCVAPGAVKTKFGQILASNETVEKHVLSVIPMRRFGKPEEIAGVVSFLVSNDADYITGETIVVAGGTTSRL